MLFPNTSTGPHDETAGVKIYPWPFIPTGKLGNVSVTFTPGKLIVNIKMRHFKHFADDKWLSGMFIGRSEKFLSIDLTQFTIVGVYTATAFSFLKCFEYKFTLNDS